MIRSYENSFTVTTYDDVGGEVAITSLSDEFNTVEVSYRSFNKRVDVSFERSPEESTAKNLQVIIVKLNDMGDTDIATIKPKFNIPSVSSGGVGSVVGYVTAHPPVVDVEAIDPGAVDAKTSFTLESADQCLVLIATGGAVSIDSLTLESFMVGYEKPFTNPADAVHVVVNEVTNRGPNAASGVEAEIEHAEGLTIQNIEVSDGSFSEVPDENSIEWVIGDIPVGQTRAVMFECINSGDYEETIEFSVEGTDEDPNDNNTWSTVVPGSYIKPTSIIRDTGYVFEGFTTPSNVVTVDDSAWKLQSVHPDGVCMLREAAQSINPYVAFSSYREGVTALSEAFRAPTTIQMLDTVTQEQVDVPLVESKLGTIAVKGDYVGTVVTARYSATIAFELPPTDPENPEDPPLTEERTFNSIEVFHFLYDMADANSPPVMTKLTPVAWNTMERVSDVLEDPNYILYAGSRVVHVASGTMIAQGSNGMRVTMSNGGTFSRVFYTGNDTITQVRVVDGTVQGTSVIPYGNAQNLKVLNDVTPNDVFVFSYEWLLEGEMTKTYKAFELVDEEPFSTEIEIDGLTAATPYDDMYVETVFDGGQVAHMLMEIDEDLTPPVVMGHRMITDGGDVSVDPRVLFSDELNSNGNRVFIRFPDVELKNTIVSPTI